jgi:Ni,Fe-hydrogenase III large subunit
MKRILDGCDDFEDILVGNEIFEARTRGIGIIPGELGAAYGLSGANLRASGIDWDLRRDGGLPRLPDSTSRSGPPTATRTPATGCASRRRARPR